MFINAYYEREWDGESLRLSYVLSEASRPERITRVSQEEEDVRKHAVKDAIPSKEKYMFMF